jgi:hypothetical protein
VALTIGLAVVVLALVALGLRAAGGRDSSGDPVEVEARRDVVPPTTTAAGSAPSTTAPGASPSTTVPGASPSTTVPGSTATTPPTSIDLATPKIQVTDADGRFGVTVPRTWLNVPTSEPDQDQWVPLVPLPTGELGRTDYVFAVRWAPSAGCTLETCTTKVVDNLKTAFPGVAPVTTPDRIGSLGAIRIEASTPTQRLVAWVVVEGDRYWVPQLRGPPAQFDAFLAVAGPVVATMTFG